MKRIKDKQIREFAMLVATELGNAEYGSHEKYSYTDDKMTIQYWKNWAFGKRRIYVQLGRGKVFEEYDGTIDRLNYGKWVDYLHDLAVKAEGHRIEREAQEQEDRFGDIPEDEDIEYGTPHE